MAASCPLLSKSFGPANALLAVCFLLIVWSSHALRETDCEWKRQQTLGTIEDLAREISHLQERAAHLLAEAQSQKDPSPRSSFIADTSSENGCSETVRRRLIVEEEIGYPSARPLETSRVSVGRDYPMDTKGQPEERSPGTNLFQYLKQKGKDVASTVKGKVLGAVGEGEHVLQKAEEQGDRFVEGTKETVDSVADSMKDKVLDVVGEGERLLHNVEDKGKHLAEATKDTVDAVRDTVRDKVMGVVEGGERVIEKAAHRGQHLAEIAKEKGQELLQRTEEKIKSTAHTLKEGALASKDRIEDQSSALKEYAEGWSRTISSSFKNLARSIFGSSTPYSAAHYPSHLGYPAHVASLPPREVGPHIGGPASICSSESPSSAWTSTARTTTDFAPPSEKGETLEVHTTIDLTQKLVHP